MNVFDDLRHAFREAVENFKEELNRDQVTDTVDDLLREMGREIVDARTYVDRLEEDAQAAVDRAEAEQEEAATCRRREQMAERIDDDQTARIARVYAEKHERHAEILQKKAAALTDEIRLRKTEIGDMERRLKKARIQRESLQSAVGTTRARKTVADDELFVELDRMAERIDDEERYAEAVGDVDRDPGDSPGPDDPGERELEQRLEELKRRMQDGEPK